jgi:dTDP-glucose 4,6-dehydratase
MKVLVMGSAGFIGSAVCRYLTEESDDEIVVADSFTYAANPAALKPLEAPLSGSSVRTLATSAGASP